jgi:serine protease Do
MRISTLALVGILVTAPGLVAQQASTAPTAPPAVPKAKMIAAMGGSYLGVNVQEIDGDRAKALKLREEAGVEITSVKADSPAEKAGLKSGDAILQYNGQRVEGMEQFSRFVRETPAGREVKLEIWRNGTPQSIAVKLMAHPSVSGSAWSTGFPAAAPRAFAFATPMPDLPRSFMSWQSSMLGVEAESLDGQLAQYFGVKEGVLVRSVTTGSAAEKGGLKAGDVIIRVDDSKISTPADVSNRIRSMQGKQVPIVVMRDRKEVTLTVTIDENHHAEWWQQDPSNGQNWFVATPRARVISLP